MASDGAGSSSRRTAAEVASTAAGPPVRTLHVELNEDGTVGGSHRAMYDLMTRLDRDRYEPVALFYQTNEYVARLRERGVQVIEYDEVRRRERRLRRERGRLGRALELAVTIQRRFDLLRKERIDLVHINNSPWPAADDWLPAAKLLRTPAIAGMMGVPPSALASKPLHRWLVRHFDRLLPVSQLIADMWHEAGVPSEKLRIVHHGVDFGGLRARVRRRREEVRTELHLPENSIFVAMVGNVREWKGQHVAIEALHLLEPRTRERTVLAIAGAETQEDVGYRARLDGMISGYGLKDRVRFLGFRTDVPDLMAAADVVLHASVKPEPGGIVVLEAMALGAAVVAAAVGGHTEVMVEGTGLVFDTSKPAELAARLTELAGDPDLRMRLGQAATERIRQFSTGRMTRETQLVYEDLLGR